MWTMVTGKKISSDNGDQIAGRREEVTKEQKGLKLTNRFTFQEEEETSLNTNYLMQVEDHGIFGMFMIGKRNMFKLGKARKVKINS